jgi:hypothetical protein
MTYATDIGKFMQYASQFCLFYVSVYFMNTNLRFEIKCDFKTSSKIWDIVSTDYSSAFVSEILWFPRFTFAL